MDDIRVTPPTYAFFKHHNPVVALDWRGSLRQELAERRGSPSPRVDDLQTRTAVRFLKTQSGTKKSKRTKSPPELAIVAAARELRLDGGHDRLLVEAYGLTRLEIPEIAARVKLAPAVVAMYYALFFDVRERLDARMFIILRAIGRHPAGLDASRLVRLFAFYGGPVVVDHYGRDLLKAGTPGQVPDNPAVVPMLAKWHAVLQTHDPKAHWPLVLERAEKLMAKRTQAAPDTGSPGTEEKSTWRGVDWDEVEAALRESNEAQLKDVGRAVGA